MSDHADRLKALASKMEGSPEFDYYDCEDVRLAAWLVEQVEEAVEEER
jgi:hypothetical protein